MKLTKQQKAYVAVLGLGLFGLAVDRFLLTPASAEAAGEAAAEVAVGGGTEAGVTSSSTKQAEARPTLADRLREVERAHGLDWSEASVRDAFRTPDAWRAELRESGATPEVQTLSAADLFQQTYQLHAVVTGRSVGLARLTYAGGERLLKVGESLEGVELVGLNARTATFRPVEGGPEFRLELPTSHLKPGGDFGPARGPQPAPEQGGPG